ncbi:MAG: ribonuclease P protein component [Chlorobiaceae bacterium]|nr:ribonuclease P protein component [Chlorobiaceae bacterium]
MRKYEILRARNLTARLFKAGKSVRGVFLTIVYTHLMPETSFFRGNSTVLFAVSKRNVPSAVMRNRIKRLMREAYRLEKPFFTSSSGGPENPVSMAFVYTGRKTAVPGLDEFRKEMRSLMRHPGLC